MIFENKKGGEKIISIWMFAVWIVIGLAIVIGVMMIYSSQFDIRDLQSDALAKRLVNCFIENGFIKNEVLNEEEFDVFSSCNLNKNLIEKEDLFYFKAIFKDIDTNNELRKPIVKGDPGFETYCAIKDISIAKNFPECSYYKLSTLYLDNDKVKVATIDVVAGSNNLGGRL